MPRLTDPVPPGALSASLRTAIAEAGAADARDGLGRVPVLSARLRTATDDWRRVTMDQVPAACRAWLRAYNRAL